MDEVPPRYLLDSYNQSFLYQFTQLHRNQPWILSSAVSPKQIIPPFSSHLYMPTSQEPPVLQNPERVVRHSESERFERTYQPNVALAPRTTVLTKERDFEKDTERPGSVIKCELQIKQERPSTPIISEQEVRNSPETSGNGVSAPISPEGQSGSNEITSSTSPVPANIPNKESMSPPPSSQSRSHLHTIHKTPVVVKVTTNQQVNGVKKVPILGNPEFELSTDTDEESLGEPDSSNVNGSHPTAYEIAKMLLKNNSVEDHDKVLNLIKFLENEVKQLKEIHKKEIRELKHQKQASEEDLQRKIDSLQRPTVNSTVIATSCLSSSSSSSSSSSLSSSSYDYDRLERRNSIVEKPNVIIKPLKKSFRITSCLDDIKPTATPSIVIMPKREDIINNNNNSKLYNNNNATIVNGQTESLEATIKAEKL